MEMLGKMLRHFNGSKPRLATFQPSYLLSLVDKLLHPSEVSPFQTLSSLTFRVVERKRSNCIGNWEGASRFDRFVPFSSMLLSLSSVLFSCRLFSSIPFSFLTDKEQSWCYASAGMIVSKKM